MSHENTDIIIALIGVISMIIARLLDWYFPLGRNRSRRQISEEVKVRQVEENKVENGDDIVAHVSNP